MRSHYRCWCPASDDAANFTILIVCIILIYLEHKHCFDSPMDWSKLNNLVQRQVKHSPWIDFDDGAQRWSMIINVVCQLFMLYINRWRVMWISSVQIGIVTPNLTVSARKGRSTDNWHNLRIRNRENSRYTVVSRWDIMVTMSLAAGGEWSAGNRFLEVWRWPLYQGE